MLRVCHCALAACTSLVIAGQGDPVPLRVSIEWAEEQPIAFTHTQTQTTNKPESLPVTVPVSTRLPDGSTADGVWITSESPIGMRGIEVPLFIVVEPDGAWNIETSYLSAVDAPLRITRPIRVTEGGLPVRFRDLGDPALRLDHPSLVPGPASAVSNPPITSGFNYDSAGEPAGLDLDEFNDAMSRAIAAVNAMLVADQTFSLTLSIIWDTPSPTESFLMYALPVRNDRRWGNVKTAFNALYTENDNDPAETVILDNLPPGSLVDYSSNAFTVNATDDICLADPLLQKYFNAGGAQAVIAIDPTRDWDFDGIDGIDSGRYDFVAAMIHEIGHHLGFMCELEAHETNQLYNFVSNWDIFRINSTVSGEGPVVSVSEFRTASRELRFGVASGGMTWVQNSGHFYELSTGDDENNPFSPTSGQSSHWAFYDSDSPLHIGVMARAFAPSRNLSDQYGLYLTPADVEAFDVMGYDIDQNVLAFPVTKAILNTPLASADLDPRFAIDFEWDKGSSVSSSALIIRDATMDPGDPNSLVFIQRDLTASSFSVPAETLEPLTDYTWEVTSVRTGGVQESERRALATTCPADMNGDGVLDNGDICAFVVAFLVQDPITDWNLDGIVDNGDIEVFVAAFMAGC